MFAVVSPAKRLDFESPLPHLPEQTTPRFLEGSAELADQLRGFNETDLAKLMKVSDKIAHLNVERFATWRKDMSDDVAARVAVLAFRGDTYQGLDVDHFDSALFAAAQNRLRILSGLYGLLRPLDRIRPYRLEMGTKLATAKGSDLYQFWGDSLTRQLATDMEDAGSKTLVNLASHEYFRAIDTNALPFSVVSPVFQDEKNSRYKIISFYAKKARGMMAAWILRQAPEKPKDLTAFDIAGYSYDAAASTPEKPVFRRPEGA